MLLRNGQQARPADGVSQFFDECWFLLDSPVLAPEVVQLFRTARKRNASVWGMSQTAEDFVGTESKPRPHGAGIVKNSTTKIIGQQPGFRGSILLPGRKRPLRRIIAVSNELAGTVESGTEGANRTILLRGEPVFVLYRLATRFGLPVIQDWSEWFWDELQMRKLVKPLLGIGCCPVVIYGTTARFLSLISWGLKRGAIVFPSQSGPTCWTLPPELKQISPKCLLEYRCSLHEP